MGGGDRQGGRRPPGDSNFTFSSDGLTLAASFLDNTIRLLEVATGKEIAVLRGSEERVVFAFVAFSPDGRRLVASFNNDLWLWEVATGKEIAVLRGHGDWVKSVAFSPDGRTLATGSGDKTVRLWEVATGKEIAVLPSQETVDLVAFTPDGRRLVTLAGGTTRLWPLGQDIIDFACMLVHELPLSDSEKERFGIDEEWCTPKISGALRAAWRSKLA